MAIRLIVHVHAALAADFLRSAVLFAERAALLEKNPPVNEFERTVLHRSLVMSSILASACSLETTINEWFTWAHYIDEESPLSRKQISRRKLISRLWSQGIPRTASFQVLHKYQIALIQLNLKPFDEGAEPYQSARTLVDLRNWLVHFEPTIEPILGREGHPDAPPPHKLTKRLQGKFPVNPFGGHHAFWPGKCLGAGCAIWAAESAFVFMDTFFECADPESSSRPLKDDFEKARNLGQSANWNAYGV